MEMRKTGKSWFEEMVPPSDDTVYVNGNGAVLMSRGTFSKLHDCYLLHGKGKHEEEFELSE